VQPDDLETLNDAISHGEALPERIHALAETSPLVADNPIQILRFDSSHYLAMAEAWSEITISKIELGRPLVPTCELKYPDVPPIGPPFQQWLRDIEQIQGQETTVFGTGHFLVGHLIARRAFAELAASRPADLVEFGLYPPVPAEDDRSPLQVKLDVELWGLEGPWNHVMVQRLDSDMAPAVAAIADYYGTRYGVDAGEAVHGARVVADAILVASLYFYDYGRKEREGKRDPSEIEQRVRDRADEFARLPADQRRAKVATDLIRPAILAGASKDDIASLIAAGAMLGERANNDRFSGAIEPALFFALDRPEIMRLLIENGANVDEANAAGKTALMYAARLNRYDALDLLLKANAAVNSVTTGNPPFGELADIYAISRFHRSALMYAAENASARLIDRLIDAGADVRAMDSEGKGISVYLDANPLLTTEEKDAILARLPPSR
jgi:hypothetical protein